MTAAATSNLPGHDAPFIVTSEIMRKFMGMVDRVASHTGAVLILGETGTGKERIAQTIHEQSRRCGKPFIDINCAALPENLVESELFGYEKGAFSGADAAKAGLFEMAHLGTIFLDEIGELDLRIQVKLLRVLDRAPYYRLGGNRKISTDVRVVAATNRDLAEEVRAGRFRKDLYHRLSQFVLCVPPLRERSGDIAAMAEHFLVCEAQERKFSPEALHALQSYSWPGNVRELQNLVARLSVADLGPVIEASVVHTELKNAGFEAHEPKATVIDAPKVLENLQAQAIERALEKYRGHRGLAAAELGISRRTLSRKLREYGLTSGRRVARAALGTLDDEQRRLFRVALRIPVMLQTAEGKELSCTAVNLSESGMGLESVPTGLSHNCQLRVRFTIPGSALPIEAPAVVAWVGVRGSAGIAFTNMGPVARHEIKSWLSEKMLREGWTVQPDPSETVRSA
ncbi:MAG TPA: sigma 54-interacting transcriptional regulator [Candidatus Angelobacter sp.]